MSRRLYVKTAAGWVDVTETEAREEFRAALRRDRIPFASLWEDRNGSRQLATGLLMANEVIFADVGAKP